MKEANSMDANDERRRDARRHYYVHMDQLARLLNVPGEAIRIWDEPDTGFVHLIVADPDGYIMARGCSAPVELLPTPERNTG